MAETFFLVGDCRETLTELLTQSVQCVVTSPPYYGLRDYNHTDQIGLEKTPDAYVAELVAVFREVRRVLRDDGTLWLVIGDSYNTYAANRGPGSGLNKNNHAQLPKVPKGAGLTVRCLKNKDLIGIPWMVAFALRADGWYLRSDVIWHKPNVMPESATDRPTSSHEHVFLFSKKERYFYDAKAIREEAVWTRKNNPDWQKQRAETNAKKGVGNRNAASGGFTQWKTEDGRNARNVWTIATRPYPGAHFATYPPDLAEKCILAGSRPGDIVLDPFAGAGTTGLVAYRTGRHAILCELNAGYVDLARARISKG